MKRLLLLPLLLGLTSPVQARVDPEVHKLCKDVKDYFGCVKAMTGKGGEIKQVIGNECPTGYAYTGQGNCREVRCVDRSLSTVGNDQIIGGKKWRCRNSIGSSWSLALGGNRKDIGTNPKCPSGEPEIGWTSTCEAPYEEPPKKDRILGRLQR